VQFFQYITIVLLFIGSIACSSVDLGGEGGEGNNAAPTTFKGQLTGDWSGHMINKTVTEGSNLRESTINAEFKFKNDTEGTFLFTIPTLEKATANGTFADFAGKSLHLTINKSSISIVGASSSSSSVNYTIIGNSMELSNDRISLQLIKGKKAPTTNPNDDDSDNNNQPADDLIGSWECKDSNSKTWSIVTKSHTEFFAEVYGNSSAPAVWLGGGMTIATTEETGTRASAAVINSNNADYVGMHFYFTFKSATVIGVERLKSKEDSDDTVEDSFECTRKK
jgi:hypothetical protein